MNHQAENSFQIAAKFISQGASLEEMHKCMPYLSPEKMEQVDLAYNYIFDTGFEYERHFLRNSIKNYCIKTSCENCLIKKFLKCKKDNDISNALKLFTNEKLNEIYKEIE